MSQYCQEINPPLHALSQLVTELFSSCFICHARLFVMSS
jgi:hypothetical protein